MEISTHHILLEKCVISPSIADEYGSNMCLVIRVRHARTSACMGSWDTAALNSQWLDMATKISSKISRYIILSNIMGYAFVTWKLDLLQKILTQIDAIFPGDEVRCALRVCLLANSYATRVWQN